MGAREVSKYKARRTTIDGITFHSGAEAKRWCALKVEERAGLIRNLERQKPFVFHVGGVAMFKYLADFVYFRGQERIIEDVKGYDTPVSRLKRKLIEAQYHVKIQVTK